MKQRIEEILRTNLQINFLEVVNNSYLHSGHVGDDGSGETHFKISISSNDLKSIRSVEAHRKINKLLKEEFGEGGLHALEIKIN